MANFVENGGKQSQSTENRIKNIPILYRVSHNVFGCEPDGCTWMVSLKEMQGFILQLIQLYSKDFKYVSISSDTRGYFNCIAFIPRNSPDVTDTSLKNDDRLIIHCDLQRDSESITDLKNTYCFNTGSNKEREEARKFYASPENPQFLGLRLDMSKLINKIFDGDGVSYANVVDFDRETGNSGPAVASMIQVAATHDGNGRLNGFRVTKARTNSKRAEQVPMTIRAGSQRIGSDRSFDRDRNDRKNDNFDRKAYRD